MGIYASHTGFFSLCEARGFRRITPFLDRPDVMASYTVTLHADRERYPVLLANGNLMAQGDEAERRHWATWKDPFPKPSYLFAVVAARIYRALLERFPNDPVAKATLHDLSPSLQPVALSRGNRK